MKMFVGISSYRVPLDNVLEHADEHGAWVQQQYADGRFLVSGRRVPPAGGLIVAHAGDIEELRQLLETDPFVDRGIASWEFFEFDATEHPKRSDAFDQFAANWLARTR
jgi:uncharacterized protein YciI